MAQMIQREKDIVGVGFGPANLALAVALAEMPGARRLDAHFIERQEGFHWHRDMQIEGSTVQISFLKDLATLRDPRSAFTFVNYLHDKGRLESFINLKQDAPTREEFTDYFRWAAAAFAQRVSYGETVESVEPMQRNGTVSRLRVLSRDAHGTRIERLTRDLVVAIGGRPRIPALFEALPKDRVIHTSDYVSRSTPLIDRGPMRVAVIGGGQSAGEVFYDVIQRFPEARASLILRDHALRPADDSPFVNEIFDADFVDAVHGMDAASRRALIASMRNTNYAVVDHSLIERIYAVLYRQRVSGEERHRVLAGCTIEAARGGNGLTFSLRDAVTGVTTDEGFDAAILATGYHHDGHRRLLEGLGADLGTCEVDRFYRVKTPASYTSRIYLQGCNEDSHGLSDTLLSILPLRAAEIVGDILSDTVAKQPLASAG